MDGFTLQPAAGAHGELTGLLIMKKYFEINNIKKDKIKFLNPEYSGHYTKHFLAVTEERTETSSGQGRRKFDRIPDRPDDFLHATIFASLILYQATGHDVISTVPQDKSGQDIASQAIDREYGYE